MTIHVAPGVIAERIPRSLSRKRLRQLCGGDATPEQLHRLARIVNARRFR